MSVKTKKVIWWSKGIYFAMFILFVFKIFCLRNFSSVLLKYFFHMAYFVLMYYIYFIFELMFILLFFNFN